MENVTGNFELALLNLIRDLSEGKKSRSEMLYDWDISRGSDWFTSTLLWEQQEKQQ